MCCLSCFFRFYWSCMCLHFSRVLACSATRTHFNHSEAKPRISVNNSRPYEKEEVFLTLIRGFASEWLTSPCRPMQAKQFPAILTAMVPGEMVRQMHRSRAGWSNHFQ